MGRLHVELTAEATATGGTTFASNTGDRVIYIFGTTYDRVIYILGATFAAATSTSATACTACTACTSGATS